MLCSYLTKELRQDGLRTSDKLVFFMLRENCERAAAVRRGLEVPANALLVTEREVAELADLSGQTQAKRVLLKLRRLGWIGMRKCGRKGTLITLLRHAPFGSKKRFDVFPKTRAESSECQNKSGSILARGVTAVSDVSSGVGVAVVSSVVLSRVNTSRENRIAAASLTARAGGPEREPVPNWSRLTEHIQATWKRKCPGLAFHPSKGDWHAVKQLCRFYQAHQVAAVWDSYLGGDDPFARRNGYALRIFVSQFEGLVLDDRSFKPRAEKYLDRWDGPIDNAVASLVMAITPPAIVDAIVAPRPAPKAPEPEPPAEPLPEGGLMAMFKDQLRKNRQAGKEPPDAS